MNDMRFTENEIADKHSEQARTMDGIATAFKHRAEEQIIHREHGKGKARQQMDGPESKPPTSTVDRRLVNARCFFEKKKRKDTLSPQKRVQRHLNHPEPLFIRIVI